MTAAALAKVLGPRLSITLVESSEIGIVGVGEATIPAIQQFNKLLKIDEDDFLRHAQGTFKLGIEFVDWFEKGQAYMHAFGPVGRDLAYVPFHHYFLKEMAGSLWDYSLNWVAAKQARFARLERIADTPLAGLTWAFHFDASLYAAYLSKFAQALGVQRLDAKIAGVLQNPDGDVRALKLEDGRELAADFFIDCTGFRGVLIEQALKTGYEDWTHWLPCDRAIAAPCAHAGPLDPFTRSTAHQSGWQWRIPLQHRMGNGHVYCSSFITDDDAERVLVENLEGELLGDPRRLSFTTGRRKQAWNRNVITMGLSSGFVEPLESTSIHMIQAGIARLIALFPDKRFNPIERDEYNRRMQSLFEWVRDFIILHYKAMNRDDSDFWKQCANMSIPDSLAGRIDQFRNKARVFADAELFNVTSWVSVMLGQGIVPEEYEPVVDGLDERKVSDALEQMRIAMRETAARLPTHEEFIASCLTPPSAPLPEEIVF